MGFVESKEELTKGGQPNIRWSQARCGYVIFSGRNYTNIQSFDTEEEAQEYIDEALK